LNLKQQVYNAIESILPNPAIKITDDVVLLGYDSLLDSMKIVELCLVLEELAEDLGFKFDWSTDTAISQSRGIFSSAGNLAAAFIAQHDAAKGK
jgi:acyl carrier protein